MSWRVNMLSPCLSWGPLAQAVCANKQGECPCWPVILGHNTCCEGTWVA
jgi:hypothetical protein